MMQAENAPVILCGLGRVGARVLDYLRAAQWPVVVIDLKLDPAALPEGVRGIAGDCRSLPVLEAAGLATARGVLICTSDDLVNVATALSARRGNPGTRIVVRMFNQNLVARLGKAVHNVYALSVSALSAPLLAMTALSGELQAAFPLPDGPRQIATIAVTEDSWPRGRSITAILDCWKLLPLALQPRVGTPSLLLDVDVQHLLREGDRLVVCGKPRDLGRLIARRDEDEADVLWSGWARRNARAIFRTLGEIDLAVRLCTLVLAAVVVASACVYHFGVGDSWASALYHTVGVIATAADLRAETYPGWVKVFVSTLRIAGAALTAAFTAIVTQYLLRARLGGALEVRRIPEAGHVVVCGLGNIGYRVVQELLRAGQQVVVIEPARDNRFLASVRRQGAAVIPADATVIDVLQQARTSTARALVAATGDELANVEIALLARELNPTQRVVVRLSDSDLAETLRVAADVRLALSIPALAAPAFVAALYGDRVHCAVRIAGQLVMVVELHVAATDDILKGQALRALAIDHALIPVAVMDKDGQLRPDNPEHRLEEGERLTAILALPNLERIYRREPVPAVWSVRVTNCPPTSREALHLLVRTNQGVSSEQAEALLARWPVILAERLTLGEAEDLRVLLRRERIEAELRSEETGSQ